MANQDYAVRHENKELFTRSRAGDADALWALILNHDALIRSTVGRVLEEGNLSGNTSELINSTARDASLIAKSQFELFSGSYLQLPHWIRVVSHNHAVHVVDRQTSEPTAEHFDEFGYLIKSPAQTTPSSAEPSTFGSDANDQALALLILEQSLDQLLAHDAALHQLIWLKYKKSWSDQQIQTFLENQGESISIREVGERITKGREFLGEQIRAGSRNG